MQFCKAFNKKYKSIHSSNPYICIEMKLLRPIGSMLLALLVVVASSNFFVDVHMCGKEVKAVSFLSEADGCGHASMPPCHRALMKGCCDNQQIQHDAQDVKKEVTTVQVPTPACIDLIPTAVLLAEVIPSVFTAGAFEIPVDPPLRSIDRTVLLAVFLI
jgi:hypothetical protein